MYHLAAEWPRLRWLILLLTLAAISGCATTGPRSQAAPTPPLAAANTGALSEWLQSANGGDPAQSGLRLSLAGMDAFAVRADSARLAAHHIRVQYYIWQDDTAGRLLLKELLQAADRGVKVRLLLDDMDVRGSDASLAAVDDHPNVEVRLFNPFNSRWGVLRMGTEFILRGSALNHRMHNKAWIVDGQLAVVGGRNIGDSYFDAGNAYNFADLDLVAVGPLAAEAGRSFNDYWNSPLAVPIGQLRRGQLPVTALTHRRDELRHWLEGQEEHPLVAHVRQAAPEALLDQTAYRWTTRAVLVADDPAKAARTGQWDPGVKEALAERFANARTRVVLVSPYFVPGSEGTAALVDMVARGVEITVLTNSLAANDVAFAHGGYARRRRALLAGGVKLYELSPAAFERAFSAEPFGLGASTASLHSKAVLIDDREAFVGSFNLDPRSAHINTELGVFFADAELSEEIRYLYQRAIEPPFSYEVLLADNGRVSWHAGTTRYRRDPGADLWRRTLARLARILPVESQL